MDAPVRGPGHLAGAPASCLLQPGSEAPLPGPPQAAAGGRSSLRITRLASDAWALSWAPPSHGHADPGTGGPDPGPYRTAVTEKWGGLPGSPSWPTDRMPSGDSPGAAAELWTAGLPPQGSAGLDVLRTVVTPRRQPALAQPRPGGGVLLHPQGGAGAPRECWQMLASSCSFCGEGVSRVLPPESSGRPPLAGRAGSCPQPGGRGGRRAHRVGQLWGPRGGVCPEDTGSPTDMASARAMRPPGDATPDRRQAGFGG